MRRALLSCFTLLCAVPPLRAQSWAALDAAIRKGIADRIYPGAVVVVGRADTILYAKGYGHFTWSAATAIPDPTTTLWDLASLTKVVATTASTAVLVDRKQLDLDAPVARYLPEFTGGKKAQVTVRMLLDHTSGMPAGYPFHQETKSATATRQKLFTIPLARTPGTGVIYSDLNAMLAGLIVERISGKTLDAFAHQEVFGGLGLKATLWRPAPADRLRAAPTGHYRNTALAGEVNDQNAVAMGGVSGHAGLFATGLDVARYFQSWLRATVAKPSDVWAHAATLNMFLQPSGRSGSRVLGWDTPSLIPGSDYSLYGRCATETTTGHTGWTGTMGWFDRGRNLFVVLLTNRSFDPKSPQGSFKQLKEVRANVSDAARRASGDRC